jgi:16S rRNA processing protein RimM
LVAGKILGAHGLRGELRVEVLTEDAHRFGLLARVWLGLEGQEPLPWLLEGYRLHQGRVLLKLAHCDDRTTAETLRGQLVQVPFEEAIPLEEGEFFEHQIVGLQVVTLSGQHLGEIVDILYTGANEVYIVRRAIAGRGDILIPAIQDVVAEVDLEAGRLVVADVEGLW